MNKQLVIVGAGLCGSLLAALLRDAFDVTVIEKSDAARPVFDDPRCADGEVESSINRAAGLGGTTNYWHNALVEMAPADVRHGGITPAAIEPYYTRAWSFFLSSDGHATCEQVRKANRQRFAAKTCEIAHMVVPPLRANMWTLAQRRYPGKPVQVVYGDAQVIEAANGSSARHLIVDTRTGRQRIAADCVVLSAGGLSTPTLLARSSNGGSLFCGGYHDHPAAFVAKLRLRPNSVLKQTWRTLTKAGEVRAGLVYSSEELKCALYLRPALNLRLRSLQGQVRFLLSDLRNAPLSPGKLAALLRNLEAVAEGLLFRANVGFPGECYSVLLVGEQARLADRGLSVQPGRPTVLNWHITERERRAYGSVLDQFLQDFADEIVDTNLLPVPQWEFRTGAHHSGAAARFLGHSSDLTLDYFAVSEQSRTFVCDASMLRASGVANSGLTLVALTYRLADLLAAQA